MLSPGPASQLRRGRCTDLGVPGKSRSASRGAARGRESAALMKLEIGSAVRSDN